VERPVAYEPERSPLPGKQIATLARTVLSRPEKQGVSAAVLAVVLQILRQALERIQRPGLPRHPLMHAHDLPAAVAVPWVGNFVANIRAGVAESAIRLPVQARDLPDVDLGQQVVVGIAARDAHRRPGRMGNDAVAPGYLAEGAISLSEIVGVRRAILV